MPFVIAALLLSPVLVEGSILAAQTSPPASTAPAATPKPAHTRKDAKPALPALQPLPALTPPAPKPPDWPADNPPKEASVNWDSHGLLVVASNSSLEQILKEISVDTGVKVEGLSKDERIFGTYGPAPARSVLSQLLDGSNYNVLMIGDQGQGTPRRVVLSIRTGGAPGPGNANPSQANDEDTGTEEISQQPQPEEPPPPQAPPAPNGYTPGVPVRTQQQMIEEMQERQRQLEQQRQQQQQQNPQN